MESGENISNHKAGTSFDGHAFTVCIIVDIFRLLTAYSRSASLLCSFGSRLDHLDLAGLCLALWIVRRLWVHSHMNEQRHWYYDEQSRSLACRCDSFASRKQASVSIDQATAYPIQIICIYPTYVYAL